MLQINEITREFIDGEEMVLALNGLSCSFPDEGLVAIVGPSGSGKTTLINILCGLDKPTSGEIVYDNINIIDQSEDWWDDFRNTTIGIIFQDCLLFDEKTVLENTRYPLSVQNIDDVEVDKRVRETLAYVGLQEMLDKPAIKLSGGQKQRVAIARTVVKNPKIIVADEPTGNLDETNSRKVFALLRDAAKHRLVIVVSHDLDLCREYADAILTLRNGTIVDLEKKNKTTERTAEVAKISTSKIAVSFLSEPYREPKPMAFQRRFKCAIDALRMRKMRTIISMLILALLAMMIEVAFLLMYSDDVSSVTSYLRQMDIHLIPLNLKLSEDEARMAQKEYINQGEKVEEFLVEHLGKDKVFPYGGSTFVSRRKGRADERAELNEEYLDVLDKEVVVNATYFLVKPEDFEHIDLYGEVPQNEGELVISEAIAKKCNASPSDLPFNCMIDGNDYMVVGIAQKAFGMEMVESHQDNHQNKKALSKLVNTVWMLKSDKPEIVVPMQVFGMDVVSSRGIGDFVNNGVDIAPIKDVSASILEGRKPEKDNEFLVSTSLIGNLNIDIEDIAGKEYTLKNLYAAEYGRAFWEFMNLRDRVGDTITISGVASMDADYSVTDDLFMDIASWMTRYVYHGAFSLCTEKVSLGCARTLWNAGIRFDINSLDAFYAYCSARDRERTIIISLACVLIGVFLLLLIFVFSYRIHDDRKRIALLRSIGVRKQDISNMYLTETVIVASAVALLSCILSTISCSVVNKQFVFRYMEEVEIRAVSVRPGLMLMFVFGLLVMTFLAVSIPLRKLQKKKPMEIFKAV